MRAMSRKKEKSSLGEVSTEREGASQLWAVKGTEVSIMRGVVSVEIGRRRRKTVVRGLRRVEDRAVEEEVRRDRAISTVDLVWFVRVVWWQRRQICKKCSESSAYMYIQFGLASGRKGNFHFSL